MSLLPHLRNRMRKGIFCIAALAVLSCAYIPSAFAQKAEPNPGAPIFKPAVAYLSAAEGSDNSFIASAIAGTERANAEFDTQAELFMMKPGENIFEALRKIAEQGYSPIIAVGNQNVLPVQNLADAFPKTRFSVVDGLVPPLYPNVQSITFKDHEGAFLIGYIAAYVSKTDHIGFVGGMDVPLIRNFGVGYEQGAKLASPDIRVDIDMIGDTASAWNNPERAFKLAREQFDSGADVVFAPAGASSRGALKAAQMYKKLGIGVDTNQNSLYPGYVLTSLVKRVDIAVYEALKTSKEGQWQPGLKMLGLKEGALDYAVDQNNKALLNNELVDKVANVKERIINGIIDVKSYTVR